jgi:hypothetical protein
LIWQKPNHPERSEWKKRGQDIVAIRSAICQLAEADSGVETAAGTIN